MVAVDIYSKKLIQVDPSVVASQAVTTSKWDMLENGKDDESRSASPEVAKKEEEEDIDGEPMEGTNQGSEDGECPEDDDDDERLAFCVLVELNLTSTSHHFHALSALSS